MINRAHRFHGYGSLKNVYRQGKVVRGPLFAIKTLSNPKRTNYRLAVVVSRKVSKSAVVRNRIRRRLYETVRLQERNIIGPHDIVISVFHERTADEPIENLQRQVKKLLTEAGILGKRLT